MTRRNAVWVAGLVGLSTLVGQVLLEETISDAVLYAVIATLGSLLIGALVTYSGGGDLRHPAGTDRKRRAVWGGLVAFIGASAGFLLGLGLSLPILRLSQEDRSSLPSLVSPTFVIAGAMALSVCLAMWWTGTRGLLLLLPVLSSTAVVAFALAADATFGALLWVLLLLSGVGAFVALLTAEPSVEHRIPLATSQR